MLCIHAVTMVTMDASLALSAPQEHKQMYVLVFGLTYFVSENRDHSHF